jgi:hypothetical protein
MMLIYFGGQNIGGVLPSLGASTAQASRSRPLSVCEMQDCFFTVAIRLGG